MTLAQIFFKKKNNGIMAKNLLLGHTCKDCDKYVDYNIGDKTLKHNPNGRCSMREPSDFPDSNICEDWHNTEWLDEVVKIVAGR